MSNRKFIDFIIADCKRNGVVVQLPKKKYLRIVEEGYVHVAGFFDESNIRVAIDTPEPDWMQILIHEYAHFLQFKLNTNIYKKYKKYQTILSQWGSTRIAGEDTRVALRAALEHERECDKIGIDLINLHKPTINIGEYIKNANLRLYTYAYEYNTLTPYPYQPDDSELDNLMPKVLLNDYIHMPSEVKLLLEKHK